ncbi:MAG: reverse transcriptase family protein [Phycisphaerae bacterium]
MDAAFLPTRQKRVCGKIREIDAPKPQTKSILRKLHRFLVRAVPPHPCAHGGAKSRSCFTSARRHLGRRYVVTRDVRDCYPSISQLELKKRLLGMGFGSDVALLLSFLCTVRGRMAQGSPVSSDALNLFLYDADRALSAACGRNGSRYSRTYDDMVISVQSPSLAEWPGDAMRRQIEGHGLSINARKLRMNGFAAQHREQRVHNLRVNNRRGVKIVAEQTAKALALAEAYLRGAKVVSADSLEGLARKRAQVAGWMYYTRQADFGPARHIKRLLEAGDRHVMRALASRGLSARRGKWWITSKKRNEPRRLAQAWDTRMTA